MLEANFRKIHRTVGIYLAGFLVLQTLTGLFISLWTLTGAPGNDFWFRAMAWIHHGWNPMGNVYRILLGALATAQVLGGLTIYLLMRSRLRKS